MIRRLKKRAKFALFRFQNRGKIKFSCPLCQYTGPFEDVAPATGYRKHAKCPKCKSMERHRLQFLVMEEVLERLKTKNCTMLHFAPEKIFEAYFSKRIGKYETADLEMEGVDYNVDLQDIPFGTCMTAFCPQHVESSITPRLQKVPHWCSGKASVATAQTHRTAP